MKKIVTVVLSMAMCLGTALSFASCGDSLFKLESGAIQNCECEEKEEVVSVKDVAYSYEVDEEGKTYSVLTITYTDGTTKVIKTSVPTAAVSQESLVTALGDGDSVMLGADIETRENIVMNGGNLDGNGKTLNGSQITERTNCAITSTGGTVSNLNIIGAPRGIGTGSSGTYALSEDLLVENVFIDEGTYAINIGNGNGKNLTVSNSTLYGWTSYSGLSLAEFIDCTFGQGKTDYAYIRAYDATNFTNCKFEDGFKIGANSTGFEEEGVGFTITITNCYYGETLITAENFATLLTVLGDEDTESLKLCTVVVDGVTVNVESYPTATE